VKRPLVLLVCELLLGCAAGQRARPSTDAAAAAVQEARAQNAESCAPRELATAEANLRFAEVELGLHDFARAEEHLRTSRAAADDALAKSKECGKVKVVIHDKPPEAEAVLPRVVLKDSDGDGVPDADDLCPEVKGPAERRGCPVFTDQDGDGVPDDIDRCAAVPGPKENFGCPREAKLIVVRQDRIELRQQLRFLPTRSVILSSSYPALRQIAQALEDAPQISVRIEGHTDNVGSRKSNLAVSQARAEAVKQFLVEQGVDARRLTAVGYGSARPIASNATRAGKALNRRVEFRIEGPQQ
jgi:outer membrane protein OmpA-like peptidoglycan-associated protein